MMSCCLLSVQLTGQLEKADVENAKLSAQVGRGAFDPTKTKVHAFSCSKLFYALVHFTEPESLLTVSYEHCLYSRCQVVHMALNPATMMEKELADKVCSSMLVVSMFFFAQFIDEVLASNSLSSAF